MFVKRIILTLLLIFPVLISAEEIITLSTGTAESILNLLKSGTKLTSEGVSEVRSGLEKSEQKLKRSDESITKLENSTEKLETEQSELRQDLNSSTEELSSLKSVFDKAEERDRQQEQTINNLKITQGIQTAGLIVEGIVIVILGIILAGK